MAREGGSLSQDFPPLKGRASERFSTVGLASTHLSGHLTVTDYLPGQAWGGIWGGKDKQEKDMRWVREAQGSWGHPGRERIWEDCLEEGAPRNLEKHLLMPLN